MKTVNEKYTEDKKSFSEYCNHDSKLICIKCVDMISQLEVNLDL